jgi:hypothetical protein
MFWPAIRANVVQLVVQGARAVAIELVNGGGGGRRGDLDAGGCPYCAMRHLVGQALLDALAARRTPNPAAAAYYRGAIADSLRAAQRIGLQPEVLLNPRGAEVSDRIRHELAQQQPELESQARRLADIVQELELLAEARNLPPGEGPTT